MFGLDKTASRIAGIVALSVVLIFTLLALAWCSADKSARKARNEARVAASQAGLGADALERSDALAQANSESQEQTARNSEFINGAVNANDDAGEAGLRGRLAYCERERMRGNVEPDFCARLRITYPSVR